MEKFTCPSCQRTTYTAYRDKAHICPYCTTEKFLIFNPKALGRANDFLDTKIMFDRRNTDFAVEADRRGQEEVELVPVAWLIIKHGIPQNNA